MIDFQMANFNQTWKKVTGLSVLIQSLIGSLESVFEYNQNSSKVTARFCFILDLDKQDSNCGMDNPTE